MKSARTFMLLVIVVGLTLMFGSAIEKRDCPKEAKVVLEKQNVVYIGVDNPVTVSVSGIKPSDLIVKLSTGTITATQRPGGFTIRVSEGLKTTLTISYRKAGSEEIVASIDLRIKKIPDPVAYVNDIRHEGIMLRNNLPNITGVFTRMENFDFDGAFMPQSFSMSVIENGAWKEYTAQGPAVTEEMKAVIVKAKRDDKIIFHNILTKGPDGSVRKVNDVVITVK